jgi:hypothetical protein
VGALAGLLQALEQLLHLPVVRPANDVIAQERSVECALHVFRARLEETPGEVMRDVEAE